MLQYKKSLPVGVDNFEKLIKDGYYYVDKTDLISALLYNLGDANLFTRPRRFGKTLNMSMLETFFSPAGDKSVFDGLKISKETELCEAFMGKYPVIFISLKEIDADSYDTAYRLAVQIINEAAYKIYPDLKDSVSLLPEEKTLLSRFISTDLTEAEFAASLRILSRLMEKHYGSKVIVLIDEYDVPLAKAYDNGYYDKMVMLIRNLFQQVLKTNTSLKFAVLTGCMRISKESIFTGLNNLRVLGISDSRFDEYFGFTDQDVRELLEYYELGDRYDIVREWYDGYLFGNVNVYCPWDVVNYCDCARFNPDAGPGNYWINSSGNTAVRKFVAYSADTSVRNELEELINGGTVEKTIRQELTYQDMYSSVDNLWSLLFTTGYLTQREYSDGGRIRLVIPNLEIRSIFAEQILDFFKENVRGDKNDILLFYDAMVNADACVMETLFCKYLRSTVSIRDNAVRKSLKENFYQGIILGVLSVKDGWSVASNPEAGDGYCDIIVRSCDYKLGIIIEVKYAEDGNMDYVCRNALAQIEERHYADVLYDDGYEQILKYGIACYKKKCRIMVNKEEK